METNNEDLARIKPVCEEKPFFPLLDSPKSWKEDYGHENGKYLNTCCFCESQFMGHKRRVVCKECDTPTGKSYSSIRQALASPKVEEETQDKSALNP